MVLTLMRVNYPYRVSYAYYVPSDPGSFPRDLRPLRIYVPTRRDTIHARPPGFASPVLARGGGHLLYLYLTVTLTYPLVQQHWSPEELSGALQLSTCASMRYSPGAGKVAITRAVPCPSESGMTWGPLGSGRR